jgi:hypothetical protein
MIPVLFLKQAASPDHEALKFLLEEINRKWGKDTVMFATEGIENPRKMKTRENFQREGEIFLL